MYHSTTKKAAKAIMRDGFKSFPRPPFDADAVFLARVIGTVVASHKDPGLSGQKLLLIQPLNPDRTLTGKPLVATDAVGCGVTEDVFYVRSREAALPFLPAEVPTDATIVGIVDHVHT